MCIPLRADFDATMVRAAGRNRQVGRDLSDENACDRQGDIGEVGADILGAIKRVRSGAAKWKIDPSWVGVIGLSAGAIASLDAALLPDAAARPAFLGYITER